MGAHQAGRGREERAGAEEFESGLDYGSFVEEDEADADRTQALPRTGDAAAGHDAGATVPLPRAGEAAGTQHTSALSPEDLAALRGQDAAGRHRPVDGAGAGDSVTRENEVVATHPVDRYPGAVPAAGATAVGVGAGSSVGAAAGSTAAAAHPAAPAAGPTPEEQARLPKGGPRVVQVILAVLAPIVLLLGVVRLVATPAFLWLEYHRPGFPADPFGFSREDRMHYGSAGLDYLHNLAGPRYLSSLTHQGQPLFTAAEVSHMTDVKNVMLWSTLALVLLAVVCALLMVHLHRTSPGGVRRALFAGALWFLAALVALGVMAALGWSTFFATFHSLFFADGTWTFSVRDSLIRLYPGQFWLDAAITVGLLSLVATLVTLVLTWPSRRRREMSQDRRAQLEETRLRWAREDIYGVR